MSQGNIPIIKIGEVISIDDDTGMGRIQVNVRGDDNQVHDKSKLDYAFPLLPKFLHIMPKVGESVIIITAYADDKNSQRYYIGPLISQDNYMDYAAYYMDALKYLRGNLEEPDPCPDMNPKTHGAFPKKEDISIEGRKNAGVQITDNDVRVKAGVKLTNPADRTDVVFNETNPAYIMVKYHEDDNAIQGAGFRSTATIVADKINLISNSNKHKFNLTDENSLITDAEMKKITSKAHQLPYGDVLVEFLTMFRDAFNKHVHPFPTKPPCNDDNIKNLNKYNLKKILAKDIRID